MKISEYEKAALAVGVEIDEIRCEKGDVLICRAHQGARKLVYDDEGRAFVRGRRMEFLDFKF